MRPRAIPALFHNVFHSCGKLRGETLRHTRGTDCNIRVTPGKTRPGEPGGLTLCGPVRYHVCFSVTRRQLQGFHEGQTHVSAEPPPPQADPRVSRPYGDEKRPRGNQAPPGERPQAPDGHGFPVTPPVRMRAQGLPADRKLRRRREFQRVFERGRRTHGRFITLIAAPTDAHATRLGIVASRKLGGAVVRNRAKRLIREMFRKATYAGPPVDLVVIPKNTLLTADVEGLQRDYTMTLRRCLSNI